MHAACWLGVSSYVLFLLKHSASVLNAVDEDRETPLHRAVSEGNTETARLLLMHGSKTDEPNINGLKPLHIAARRNRHEIVKLLLDVGVDPLTPRMEDVDQQMFPCGNALSSKAETPLQYACENGHVETVGVFLQYIETASAEMALSLTAARSGCSKVVSKILEFPNLDIDGVFEDDTALFRACKWLNIDSIEILLKSHADPNFRCKDSEGDVNLDFHDPQSWSTKSYQRGLTPMHAFADPQPRGATEDEMQRAFRLLLEAGGNIHALDWMGCTALFHACSYSYGGYGPTMKTRLLLDAGADANIASDKGESALHRAVQTNLGPIVRLLVEDGRADINAKDQDGRTPLLLLLKSQSTTEGALQFLKYRPDLSIVDRDGNGPLHVAMRYSISASSDKQSKETELLRALLTAGASTHTRNRLGQNALHCARKIRRDHFSILCESDSEIINAQDYAGRTVLFEVVSGKISSGNKLKTLAELIEFGARVGVRDFEKGRSLLHEAVKAGDTDALRFLVEAGLAATNVSYAGDTLLHELAQQPYIRTGDDAAEELFTRASCLVDLGVNPQGCNNVGRSVLHKVCMARYESRRGACTHPIDVLLRLNIDVNGVDKDGLTALHIASTIDPSAVEKLLEAGANPWLRTYGGFTALHLAARARQSNVIGVLLSHSKTCRGSGPGRGIDIRSEDGRTALHYACRSGTHESVKLLLGAGADPNIIDKSGICPLGVCGEFEEEDSLWVSYDRACNSAYLHAAGFLLKDTERPYYSGFRASTSGPGRYVAQHYTRLEEILELLILHGADVNAQTTKRFVNVPVPVSVLDSAARSHHDYTTECFRKLCERSGLEHSLEPSFDYLYVSNRQTAARAALLTLRETPSKQKNLLEKLLRMRQFAVVESFLRAGDDFVHAGMSTKQVAELLISLGHISLLRVLTSKDPQKHNVSNEYTNEVKPLLITACERELPNMDVVRALVEDFSVDVDSRHYRRMIGVEKAYCEGPLHVLACGKQWWHLQALPYLLKAGADIEIRDEGGRTPLHHALDTSSYRAGYFHKHAAKTLIENGANTNAIDHQGQTCLAKVGQDVGLLTLLLQNGAKVTASAIFAAIKGGAFAVLEAFLAHGANPNLRWSKEEIQEDSRYMLGTWCSGILDRELYPLYYAAQDRKGTGRAPDIVRLLLKYGADPFATFHMFPSSSSELLVMSEERTVIHEFLTREDMRGVFLETPLDINRTDPQ